MFKFLKDMWKETEIPQHADDTPNTNKKGIGEPVISFVKLLEEQPENFLWKPVYTRGTPSACGRTYKLIDKKNKKVYVYCIYEGTYRQELIVYNLSFLTDQECQYLIKVHDEWYSDWVWGIQRVNQTKKQEMRQEYIDIYCKEQ